jgi:cytochrome P450
MALLIFWSQAGHLPFRTLVDFILASPILSRLAGDSAIDNERYFDFCDEAIQQRLKEEEDATDAGIKEDSDLRRKDYIHYLLHAVDPETGKGLTADELKTDASFLLAAGADTSANSVAALMYYLGCHEDSREKACGEVRAVFTSAEEIQDGPKLRSCVYLSACIDEAMRLAPSSTSPPERVVLNEGVEIDGHHIPAGIIIGSFIFGLNLSEHIYREPLRYLPERWLVDETDPDSFTKEEVDKAKHSFFPFSYGHRQCIAKNAAPRNLKVVIATLLWHFDFRQAKELTGAQATGEGEMKGLFGVKDSLITCTLGPVLEMKSRFLTG